MLPHTQRLASQDISSILRRGKRVRGDFLDLLYRRDSAHSRFSVMVSTKVDKRAVKRNRMKRLVREAISHMLPEIPNGIQAVFVVRKKLPDTEYDVEHIVSDLLRRI